MASEEEKPIPPDKLESGGEAALISYRALLYPSPERKGVSSRF
jgi:hypothetical protein